MIELLQSEWEVGATLLLFPTMIWIIFLWEKYFPEEDKRFPRKRNEQLHKWFEEERKKKFKP
jgi:hypothetical protein